MSDTTDIISSGRTYYGLDRGFIFLPGDRGIPWRGLTSLESSDDGATIESCYLDGKKISHRYVAGDYLATIESYDDPFADPEFDGGIQNIPFGFTYREKFSENGKEHYRLHIIHEVSISNTGHTVETINAGPMPDTYRWSMSGLKSYLSTNYVGSHLILDSSVLYEWILRDVEAILYGYPDGNPRIPSIAEMYAIFATMNLIIIDHGDGTWSAEGHRTMIGMLDSTEFQIVTPTAEYISDYEYSIDSLIRNAAWLE